MTSNKHILRQINIPFVLFAMLLVFALAGIITIVFSQPSAAKVYPSHAMSVRDDRCYSMVGARNQITGLLGISGQSLINAIVNTPIYDWDQGDQMNARTAAYRAYNIQPWISFITAGLRGPQKGLSLGYAEKFSFTVQMLPTVPWMADYISKQVPKDLDTIGRTGTLAAGGTTVMLREPSVYSPRGTDRDPYIANPFIYMQGAILDKNGFPKVPVISGPLADITNVINGDTSIESVLRLDSLQHMIGFQNQQLSDNEDLVKSLGNNSVGLLQSLAGLTSSFMQTDPSDLVSAIGGGVTDAELSEKASNLNSNFRALESNIENFIGDVANLPGISHMTASPPYDVDGTTGTRETNEDLCYEDISGSTNPLQAVESAFGGPQSLHPNVPSVPAYAFSMIGNPIGGLSGLGSLAIVAIPGWLYTVYIQADPTQWLAAWLRSMDQPSKAPRNALSLSGFDFVPGGSINGKEMLDCFGKGITRTMWMHDRGRMADFTGMALAANVPLLIAVMVANFSGDTPYRGMSAFDLLINSAIANGILAASAAADASTPGSGQAIRDVGLALPAMVMAHEKYDSFVPLFKLDRHSIQLPEAYRDRAIDYRINSATTSKTTDINLAYFLLPTEDSMHFSLNGSQYNPDIFLKLKEPYMLKPKIDVGTEERSLQDGTTLTVDISALKHGFNKGNTLTPLGSSKYREDPNSSGGPTFDDDPLYGDGHAFTNAKVYKLVMQPGVSPNAIDAYRVQGNTKTYYDSEPLDKDGNPQAHVTRDTNPCEFFAHQLREGDSGAVPSSRTPGSTSNANKDIQGVPEITNQQADAEDAPFTCEEIANEEVRMTSPERERELLSIPKQKIPAETPPGTKYCYAVYFDKYTNDLKTQGKDWWDGTQFNHSDYHTPEDKTFLSRAHCVISGYRPSFQVRGGDLMVDGGIYTGTNTKEWLEGEEDSEGDKPKRTYGSWAEYGVLASGGIRNIASGGLYRTGLIPGQQDFGYLTFSNKRTDSRPDYGEFDAKLNDGFDDVAKQFTAMSGQATELNASPIYIDQLESGVYRIPDGDRDVSVEMRDKGRSLDKEKSIIILVGNDVKLNIADNIITPTHYTSTAELSQVVFAPANNNRYRLNIQANVTQLDAWIVNPLGVVNTCTIPGVDVTSIENTPRGFDSPCHNELLVNGPVSAGQLVLRRSGGHDQDRDGLELRQSIPAETFNLRPDSYLWVANYVDDAGKKYITTNAIDLPPRY